MTIYIALLRGINVGGNKKIKMAELKTMLSEMGLHRVQTYIQSGNVVFESEEDAVSLQAKIEQEIHRAFGFTVTVMLRTSTELKTIIENCPFSMDSLAEGESIHLTCLTEPPSQEDISKLSDVADDVQDEFLITGKDIYIYYRQSILDSKLATKISKLHVPTTDRNWKTIMKLAAMVEAM
ncbi:MAG: DUF1697 domain-containing protein [Tumebacillaceae bacterium]